MTLKPLAIAGLVTCAAIAAPLSAVTIYENDFESHADGLSGGYLWTDYSSNTVYRQSDWQNVVTLALPSGVYPGVFDLSLDILAIGDWDGPVNGIGPDLVIINENGGAELFRQAYHPGRYSVSLYGIANTIASSGLSIIFESSTTTASEVFGIDNLRITAVEAATGPGHRLVPDGGSTMAMLGVTILLFFGLAKRFGSGRR